MSKKITINDINPIIIKTYGHNLDATDWNKYKFPKRVIDLFEFELIIKSNGVMNLNNHFFNLESGDLCFRKPNDFTQGEMPYSCYYIGFKLTNDENSLVSNDLIDSIPIILKTKNVKYYEQIFKNILELYIHENELSNLNIKRLLLELIISAIEESKYNDLPSSAYTKIIKKTICYIEKNYSSNILLTDISNYVGLSVSHFQRIFKSSTGKSPNDYLTEYRLIRSKELLITTTLSLLDIALKCGFQSHAYFSSVFKKKYHQTPSLYRLFHQTF